MPRRTRNSYKLSSSSSTTTTTTILKPPQNSSARKSNFQNNGLSPQKHNPSEKRSVVCGIPRSGSTNFPISRSIRARDVSTPRRSSRLSLFQGPNANQFVSNKISDCKPDDKRILASNEVKGEEEMKKVSILRRSLRLSLLQGTDQLGSNMTSDCDRRILSSNEVKGEVEMKTSNRSCVITFGLKAAKARASASDVCETNEQEVNNNNNRKIKRTDEAIKRAVREWTKEQEMVLQRAYFTTKPTPNFWKKVSKLVPGKSAQDCFEKVNSDHVTPTQALQRSRAKRINSSPLESSSLSASKILNPSGPKSKRLLRCEKKNHLAHKNVRELLQNQNRMDRDYEADFFAIFEPDMNPSTQDSQLAVKISTPEQSKVKQGFLHKFHERSSSGHKKPLSRLSSCGIDIVSPPVLKQVKNRALHEKYIDQLHCREAKRKAAYERAKKSAGKKNRVEINVQKIDVVRAAKNSLVSDVRDALNHLHDLQANAGSSSDFDDGVGSDDDGGESEL
uniref:Myb-like domain-containing protein n=1 Tax=Salix viminalis TaxID=40686 RepID=A0A6N2N8N0_SALVM